MLLIVTVGLVVTGIVLLVIGYTDNSLGFIYAAVACAAVAATTLIVYSLVSRRREIAAVDGATWGAASASRRDESDAHSIGRSGAGRSDERAEAAAVDQRAVGRAGADVVDREEPGMAGGTAGAAVTGVPGAVVTDGAEAIGGTDGEGAVAAEAVEGTEGAEAVGDTDGAEAGEGAVGAAGGDGAEASDADSRGEVGPGDVAPEEVAGRDDGAVFPIEDYDELGVAEIFPLIGELEVDELLEVRERELATRARGTILRRIDGRLREAGSGAGLDPGLDLEQDVPREPQDGSPSDLVAPGPSNAGGSTPQPTMDRSIEEGVEGAGVGNGDPVDGVGPIPGYATMRASEILPLLVGLSAPDLAEVGAAERSGANRATILARVGRLQARLSAADATQPPEPTPPVSPTAAHPGPPPPSPTPKKPTPQAQAPGRRGARRVGRLTAKRANAGAPQAASESTPPSAPVGDGDPA